MYSAVSFRSAGGIFIFDNLVDRSEIVEWPLAE